MPSKKNDMDDLHDARHGPLFMLYLKKLDWTAGRKVQVRHGRHDMEGLRLNTCFCQLCHGNHEWMKGLAEALEVNTAWSSRPQPNVSSSHGFNDKFGLGTFGLTSFQNTFSIMSLRKAQHWLNPPKVFKSNLHTALSHCTASWHFSALHYQFQMAPIIRENVCVLDNFSAWSSINRINGQKCHQKKMTWMTCMMHGMVPCSCCTSRSSTGLHAGKSRFVMVAMTWKVYDWSHVFASFVMETTSEWKVWPRHWRSTRRWSSRPQPNVSSSHGFNDKFGLGMFGLASFQNTFSIMSLHKAQHWLNPPKVCKSNTAHCNLWAICTAYLGPISVALHYQVVKWQSREANTPLTHIVCDSLAQFLCVTMVVMQGFGQDQCAVQKCQGSTKRGIGWHHVMHPWHDCIGMSPL